MIWFTADPEFGHDKIVTISNRPFNSGREMNEKIIENWNSVVKSNDEVYILGDFAYGDPNKYANRLNGKIWFIPGNHDKSLASLIQNKNRIICKPITEIYLDNLLDEYGNKRLIVLCHYSMRIWNKSHYCSWMLWGHSHGKLEPYGLSFDVGVDTNNFYPYSLDDIKTKMETLTPIVDYRRPPVNA